MDIIDYAVYHQSISKENVFSLYARSSMVECYVIAFLRLDQVEAPVEVEVQCSPASHGNWNCFST